MTYLHQINIFKLIYIPKQYFGGPFLFLRGAQIILLPQCSDDHILCILYFECQSNTAFKLPDFSNNSHITIFQFLSIVKTITMINMVYSVDDLHKNNYLTLYIHIFINILSYCILFILFQLLIVSSLTSNYYNISYLWRQLINCIGSKIIFFSVF